MFLFILRIIHSKITSFSLKNKTEIIMKTPLGNMAFNGYLIRITNN